MSDDITIGSIKEIDVEKNEKAIREYLARDYWHTTEYEYHIMLEMAMDTIKAWKVFHANAQGKLVQVREQRDSLASSLIDVQRDLLQAEERINSVRLTTLLDCIDLCSRCNTAEEVSINLRNFVDEREKQNDR